MDATITISQVIVGVIIALLPILIDKDHPKFKAIILYSYIFLGIISIGLAVANDRETFDFRNEIKDTTEDTNKDVKSINSSTDMLTGKGSYPIGLVSNYGRDLEYATFSFQLIGDYTISDLEIYSTVVLDYKNSSSPLDMLPDILPTKGKPIKVISNLRVGDSNSIDIKIPNEDTCFVFLYKSNNAQWGQYYYLTKKEGRFEHMYILLDKTRTVIECFKSKGYPTTKKGKVLLNKNEIWDFDKMKGNRLDFHPNNKNKSL